MIEINLIPTQSIEKKAGELLSKKVNVICLLVVILIVGLFATSFFIQNYLNSQLVKYAQDQEKVSSELAARSEIADMLKIVAVKADAVKQLQNNQSDFSKVLQNIKGIFSSEVKLSKIAIDNTGAISIGLVASNFNSLYSLLTTLSASNSYGFEKITLGGINQERDNTYTLSINAIYTK